MLSTSTTGYWARHRLAAAQARARLVDAAADAWDVPPTEVEIERGVLRHPGGQQATFAELSERSNRVANYLRALTMEVTMLARACGKSDVHNLEPEDLAALTIEAAAMARVPLAGTDWIPGARP